MKFSKKGGIKEGLKWLETIDPDFYFTHLNKIEETMKVIFFKEHGAIFKPIRYL